MRVEDRDGFFWVISERGRAPFIRICGAVAWGDDSSTDEAARAHAMVVGGELKDNALFVFDAVTEPWVPLVESMMRAVEQTHCYTWWVDPSAEGRVRELYRTDGLAFFKKVLPPEDRPDGCAARICPWWNTFSDDIEGARVVVDKLRHDKVVGIDATIPSVRKAFMGTKPAQTQAATPKAVIALLWHMYQTSTVKRGVKQEMPIRWPWGGEQRGRRTRRQD